MVNKINYTNSYAYFDNYNNKEETAPTIKTTSPQIKNEIEKLAEHFHNSLLYTKEASKVLAEIIISKRFETVV